MADQGLGRRQLITGVTAGLTVNALSGVASGQTPAKPGTPAAVDGPIQAALGSTRTQLTTAEPVELALAYTGAAENVALEVRHEDGSALALSVPVGRAHPARGSIVTIPPRVLKPGTYSVLTTDGVAKGPVVSFAVHADEHPSAYFVAAWMQADASAPTALAKGGWMYFTSDLVRAHVRKPGPDDIMERYIAARMKPFSMTVMGGGHQMDLDQKNDWADPWIERAVVWKMGLAALSNRLYPSAGLHAFDEPGLTWWPFFGADGKKVGANPFCVPVHVQELVKLGGRPMPTGPIADTITQYKGMISTFIDFLTLRLKYLEEAWWAAVSATDEVHPEFITINQLASSYARGLVTDGVDNRMNRPYRVLSGHGGYSDWAGSWGPVVSARAFDGWAWDRPHYFVPSWGPWDYARMRQEVWLSWAAKLEGLQYDPYHDWSLATGYVNAVVVLELAEVNRRTALVGDIMTRLPRTLAPVAVLMSHTQFAHDVATLNYPKPFGKYAAYHSDHRTHVVKTMWRVMSAGMVPNWVDEYEAVEKGADFLKSWRVVYCPGLAVAKPELRSVLSAYVAAGGKLVQGKGDPIHIPGAIRVGYAYEGPNPPPGEGPSVNDYADRKYNMDLAPGFEADLEAWTPARPFKSNAPVNSMVMSVHRAGLATYVLMGNNSQDPLNTRRAQMDPIPLETTIRVPAEGTLYDLLNGGAIQVHDGTAPLKLAAGDGACWLHLPGPPEDLRVTVEPVESQRAIAVTVTWGIAGYLPFRLRLYDPGGNLVEELYRATTPIDSVPLSYGPAQAPATKVAGATCAGASRHVITLGANAAPGTWTVEAHEWLTFTTTTARVSIEATSAKGTASIEEGAVSIYYADARKIIDLFAGRAWEPPFEKMGWDCRRVFRLDPRKFAVFGPDDAAGRIAAALRAKGMTVDVNPAYEIVPFEREPDHGGTGPVVDAGQHNFENIYAHTVVLPGHALGKNSWERGHINRPITATFPGPGRAYVQWGMGGYQAGFHNVWIYGDAAAGVNWLLAAIAGKEIAGERRAVPVTVRPAPATQARFPQRFSVAQEIKLWDTPVGIGSSPDRKVIYVLLAGGSVAAYGASGRPLWETKALLQGGCLAVSPRGDRLAVGGFPGLLVLDAVSGRVVGSRLADPPAPGKTLGSSRLIAAAWNDEGTIVAAGGIAAGATVPALQLAILDAGGKTLPAPTDIAGDVMGVAFVPRTSTLLAGAAQLTAVDATTGGVTWRNGIAGAQSLRFSADGASGAAGGFGRGAGSFRVSDGKVIVDAAFPSNVGGVALLPNGDVVAAIWGGTHPLYRITAKTGKAEVMAKGRFAFHDTLLLRGGVVAAEQGGPMWFFDEQGNARARLDDAGTTAFRMEARGDEVLVGRMNRVVQRIAIA